MSSSSADVAESVCVSVWTPLLYVMYSFAWAGAGAGAESAATVEESMPVV